MRERPITNEMNYSERLGGIFLACSSICLMRLERTIRTSTREESVVQLLKMMAGHANHHIRAIWRIREKHGC